MSVSGHDSGVDREHDMLPTARSNYVGRLDVGAQMHRVPPPGHQAPRQDGVPIPTRRSVVQLGRRLRHGKPSSTGTECP